MRRKLFGVLLGLTIVGTPGVANANLIVNGGFETGDLTGWSCTTTDDCFPRNNVATQSGAWALAGINNTGFATLSQSFATVAAQTYTLSFWSFSTRDFSTNILQYAIDGAAAAVVPRTTSYANTVASFTATNAVTELSFLFQTVRNSGFWVIDDVSVVSATPIPEPSTIGLFTIGLAGLGLAARRRKRALD